MLKQMALSFKSLIRKREFSYEIMQFLKQNKKSIDVTLR